VRLLAVIGAAGLLLAMGRYGLLHFIMYQFIPPLRRLRIPARAIVLFDFAAALLAAYGLREVMTAQGAALLRRLRLVARIAAAVFAVALVIGFARLGSAGGGLRTAVARGAMLHLVIFGGATIVVLMLAAAGRASGRARGTAFIAIALLDLAGTGWDYSAGHQSPDQFFRGGRESIITALQGELRHEYFRINSRPLANPGAMVLPRNSGPILGIYTIEGYNQLKLAVFEDFKVPPELRLDLLNVKYRSELTSDALRIVPNPGYLPRVFVVDHAREMADPDAVLESMDAPGFDPRVEALLLPDADASGASGPGKDAGGDATAAAAPAEHGAPSAAIRRYEPNRIEVDVKTDVPGWALFSEIWYPAWRASVDGKPARVRRADYAFRAVRVPAGAHHVVITMSDAPLRRGLLAGVAGLIGVAVLVVIDERRRRVGGSAGGR